jgi:hypothetical protein
MLINPIGAFTSRVGRIQTEKNIGKYGENTQSRKETKLIFYSLQQVESYEYRGPTQGQPQTYTGQLNFKDLLLITVFNEKLVGMFLDTRIFQSPETESGHYLFLCPIQMRLRWYKMRRTLQNPEFLFP